MAKVSIKAGTTSKLIDIFVQDSSSTTGGGLTGLVYNAASLTAYYYREGAASATAITLATMTLGTWATGGFIVVDGTNMPGCYQLGIPDAAIAAGAKSVLVMLKGATNMAPLVLEIELTAVDNQSATAFITGVNSLAPPSNWNLASIDGNGRVDVIKVAGTTQTAGDIIGDTNDIQTRLPAALVSGRMDASVGAMAANVMTAAAAAADLTTELQSGLATAASLATVAGYLDTEVADIQARLPAALVGGRMDSNISAIGSDTAALTAFKAGVLSNVVGTCAALSTTTSIISSALTPAGAAADQFKGRIIIFDKDTTTTALRGQATDITASTNAATPTFTVTALTTAPVSGDTFVIV